MCNDHQVNIWCAQERSAPYLLRLLHFVRNDKNFLSRFKQDLTPLYCAQGKKVTSEMTSVRNWLSLEMI
jgi:hypothetical protein